MKNNKEIPYKDKLDYDAFLTKYKSFYSNFYHWKLYTPELNNILGHLFDDLKNCNFNNALICVEKVNETLPSVENCVDYNYVNEIQDMESYLNGICEFCKHFIEKDYENFNSENIELTEKENLKLKNERNNFRLQELQEESFPYLNLSLIIMFVLMSVIFCFIPTFFVKPVVIYHICGIMFFFALLLLKPEIKLRIQNGFVSNSNNATNKKSISYLIQSIIYAIPLAVLCYFFYDLLLIRILLFVQIFFCGVLFLNGMFIFINNAIKDKKLNKSSFWNIILGIITIVGFVIQILQLFKVF